VRACVRACAARGPVGENENSLGSEAKRACGPAIYRHPPGWSDLGWLQARLDPHEPQGALEFLNRDPCVPIPRSSLLFGECSVDPAALGCGC
jgi:hypothetical protein